MSHTETLRNLIMEEIFDQKLALTFLSHLENIKEDIGLSDVRVTDREEQLQDHLMELEVTHDKALTLLNRMAGCLDKMLKNPYTNDRIETHFVDEPKKVIQDYLKFVHK